jgi:glycosyltransferase involved in cell wall biosynthesis
MTARESKAQAKKIIGLFPELLGVGGIQEAGRLTAAALKKISLHQNGWSTYFQSLSDPPGVHEFVAAEGKICARGFGRHKARFVLSAVRQSRQGARAVLAAHPHLALPAAGTKWFSPQIKTLVMSHGVEVWKPLPWLRRRALLSADIVLAPSSDTAQKLAEIQGVPQSQIRKLAWPLNPDFLRLADARTDLHLPKEFPRGRVILTVGRWAASERYKGADDLIRSMVQLRMKFPDLYLVAVGEGDDLSRLKKIAVDAGVSGSVRLLTSLSRQEIAACYARCEIFALPSTGEGFGLVFLEAMAFGKPLVGAACGGTTDVVEDNVNGLLVPARDSERLAEALAALLQDELLRTKLGRHGAEIVRRDYSFEVFQSKLKLILEECGLDFHRQG